MKYHGTERQKCNALMRMHGLKRLNQTTFAEESCVLSLDTLTGTLAIFSDVTCHHRIQIVIFIAA